VGADGDGDPCVGADGDGNCAESCNANGDNCTAPDPNGTACDDGLFCTLTDTCVSGHCAGTGNPCIGGDECNDSCSESADTCADAAGIPCASDGNPCTQDLCDDEVGYINAEEPRAACLVASPSSLQIRDSGDDDRDQFRWKWLKGEMTSQAELGDPSTATAYTRCVYDTAGGMTRLATLLQADPNPAWLSYAPRGWRLKDAAGTFDGVR
jgi:hypothetical protein